MGRSGWLYGATDNSKPLVRAGGSNTSDTTTQQQPSDNSNDVGGGAATATNNNNGARYPPQQHAEYDVNHVYSLQDFDLSGVIDKGCNAVVYAARWKVASE